MKKSILYILVLLLSTQGCVSFHEGNFQTTSFTTKDNFRIITTIQGDAQATYFLGIGGGVRDGLLNEAKRNMYSTYLLEANQNITNITTDVKVTGFILPALYQSKKVIVTADIIEFYDSQINVPQAQSLSSNNATAKSSTEILVPSVSQINSEKLEDEKNFKNLERLKTTKPILSRITSLSQIKIGDILCYKPSGLNSAPVYGYIVRIDNKIILVKSYSSSGERVYYEDDLFYFKKLSNPTPIN